MDGALSLSLLDEDDPLPIVYDVGGAQGPPPSPTAALSFLDEALTTAADDTSSTDKKHNKPRKKRRRDRNRPWHEIARLRSETNDLERELQEQLVQASKRARCALGRRNENVELRAMLRESVECTHTLEQKLRCQVNEIVKALPRSLGMVTQVFPFDLAADKSVFQSLAQSVDDQYVDMARIFRRVGLDETASEVRDAFICRASSVYPQRNDADMLKFRSRIFSPFNRNILEKAFWRYIDQATLGTSGISEKLEISPGLASHVVAQKYEIAAEDYVGTHVSVNSAVSETGSSSSSQTSTPSGPSFWPAKSSILGTSQPTPKIKKQRRKDRNRPIHEIHRLQTQVKEMEHQLKTLKPDPSAESDELLALKRNNVELKEKLKKSLENTAAVEHLLQTQTDKLLQTLPKSLAVSGQNLAYDFEEDDAVFQVLAQTVDGHYLDMNRVFGAAGLNNATSEIFDAYMTPVKTAEDAECVLKTRTCAFLPYGRDLVEQAMWRRLECESAILPENIRSSNDLGLPLGIASNIIVSKREVHLDNAAFTIRLALKEFTEADRLVYVWDAIGDWPRAMTVPHVSTREYGWSYFEHTDCPELSILRSFVMVTPKATPGADEELVERVMQLYRHTIELRYQKLENTLVDAAISSRKPVPEAGVRQKKSCCVTRS
ncbi:hypothetical protein PRIC2_012092 [Phytophthora ramorum]